MQVTAIINKILENVKGNLIFIFDELSESRRWNFFSFSGFLGCRKCFKFHSNSFPSKMRENNYMKTFHANIGHNLAQKLLTRYLYYGK